MQKVPLGSLCAGGPVAQLYPPTSLLPARCADLSLAENSLWGDREKGETEKTMDTRHIFSQ